LRLAELKRSIARCDSPTTHWIVIAAPVFPSALRSLSPYGVSKSAAWALTNGLRQSLREQRTQVVALHAGFIDTDLTRDLEVPKATPTDVVRQAYEAIEAGAEEVSTDEFTRQVKAGLSAGIYLNDAIPH
jgi:NAD(P)-dependent dehydrogenase (short-subunit alcohol dehydrogenase family)